MINRQFISLFLENGKVFNIIYRYNCCEVSVLVSGALKQEGADRQR